MRGLDKCKRCGCDISKLTKEEMEEFGIMESDALCDECYEELDEQEKTCPIHKIYTPDDFCEACLKRFP